jgi:hypothetical protein
LPPEQKELYVSANVERKSRSGSRKGDRKYLVDEQGSFLLDGNGKRVENPLYRKRSGGQDRYRKYMPDGSLNPRYDPTDRHKSKFARGHFIAVDGEGRQSPRKAETRTRRINIGPNEKIEVLAANYEIKQTRAAREREWVELRGRIMSVCQGITPSPDYPAYTIPLPVRRPRNGTAPDVVAQLLRFEDARSFIDHLNWIYSNYKQAQGWKIDKLSTEQKLTTEVRRDSYVLLATSEGASALRPGGLSTLDCLNLLIQQASEHPKAIFVGYSLQHDCEWFLRDLPRDLLYKLWKGEKVMWRGYTIEYRPRHFLWVQDSDWRRTRSSRDISFTLYDVIGFFAQSFLKTLKEWYPECPDLDLIAAGKELRDSFGQYSLGEFKARVRTAIRRLRPAADEFEIEQRTQGLIDHYPRPDTEEFEVAYNGAENRGLVEVMRRFRQALEDAGITISRWDGGGAIAASLLRREGVKAHMTRRRVPGVDESGEPCMVDRDEIPPGCARRRSTPTSGAGSSWCRPATTRPRPSATTGTPATRRRCPSCPAFVTAAGSNAKGSVQTRTGRGTTSSRTRSTTSTGC